MCRAKKGSLSWVAMLLAVLQRGRTIGRCKLSVEIRAVGAADFVDNIQNAFVGVYQQQCSLCQLLHQFQVPKSLACALFQQISKIIGIVTKIPGSTLQCASLVILFNILQNQKYVAFLWQAEFIAVAQGVDQLSENSGHINRNQFLSTDAGGKIFAQQKLHQRVDFAVVLGMKDQVTVMGPILGDHVQQKGTYNTVGRKSAQKHCVEKGFAENNVDDDILFVFVAYGTVPHVRVQDTQISLLHHHRLPVDHEGAASAIDVIQFHIFVEMGGDGGVTALLDNGNVLGEQGVFEIKEIDLFTFIFPQRNVLISGAQDPGVFQVPQLTFGIGKQKGFQLFRRHRQTSEPVNMIINW